MRKSCIIILICYFIYPSSIIHAEWKNDSTIAVDTLPSDTAKRVSFFKKFINYFADANKPKPEKKFDFSIIGGPHYSSDTQFGLGLVAAGLYRIDRADTTISQSNVSLYADVSTTGFYLLGIRGNNLFPKDKYRLVYNLYFFSFPGYFWGIGYDNGVNKENKSSYKRIQNQIKVDFLIRLAPNLYAGPSASFDYVKGTNFNKPELLAGEKESTISVGVGGAIAYDTRDFLTNAQRGIYIKLEQYFYPSFLGNTYTFSRTDLVTDYYQRLWKNATLAIDFHTQLNYGNTPWTMLSLLGGSYRMRGYYEGQYRDKNLMELQIELRQNIWKRNGVVLWVGAGNVFRDFQRFDWKHTLPNYGFGYRWEFKKRVNVRLDLGFGKGQTGFIFNINEAF